MNVEELNGFGKFLQDFGGWGVSVILFLGIVYLYRTMNAILERRNEQFIEVLRETTAALQQNSDTSQRVDKTLERVERLLNSRGEN